MVLMEYFFNKSLVSEELDTLVESVGWETRRPELWEELLTYFSEGIVYVRDKERLVGLIRGFPVGDKAFLIGDLIIDSDYRKRGLGENLLDLLTNKFQTRTFFLEALPESVPFYEKYGFR